MKNRVKTVKVPWEYIGRGFAQNPDSLTDQKSKTRTPNDHNRQTGVKCKDPAATPVDSLNFVRLRKVRTKKGDKKKLKNIQ